MDLPTKPFRFRGTQSSFIKPLNSHLISSPSLPNTPSTQNHGGLSGNGEAIPSTGPSVQTHSLIFFLRPAIGVLGYADSSSSSLSCSNNEGDSRLSPAWKFPSRHDDGNGDGDGDGETSRDGISECRRRYFDVWISSASWSWNLTCLMGGKRSFGAGQAEEMVVLRGA